MISRMQSSPISVIIPTYNAGAKITEILSMLSNQSYLPDEILIVDSGSSDDTLQRCAAFPLVKVLMVEQSSFNHGATRDMAIRKSIGEFVIFLTQDAIPADEYFIANMLTPFSNATVALVYGRQLANADASPAEKLTRQFNYPPQPCLRTSADIPVLGIKAFFFSDAAAAYRRSAYLQLGGFEKNIKTNEDMFIAAKALHAGFGIYYAASAMVVHSHDFTLRQRYLRYRDQGEEITLHADILGKEAPTAEGQKLLLFVSQNLLRKGRALAWLRFCLGCVAGYLGFHAGKREAERRLHTV